MKGAVNLMNLSPVVSRIEAMKRPYPFVHIEADGSARELHAAEQAYLETPFSPFDGGRPYTKTSYLEKNGWGSIEGFCSRAAVPPGIPIAEAPKEDPNPPRNKAEQIAWLKRKMTGFELQEQPDGTVVAKRIPNE